MNLKTILEVKRKEKEIERELSREHYLWLRNELDEAEVVFSESDFFTFEIGALTVACKADHFQVSIGCCPPDRYEMRQSVLNRIADMIV